MVRFTKSVSLLSPLYDYMNLLTKKMVQSSMLGKLVFSIRRSRRLMTRIHTRRTYFINDFSDSATAAKHSWMLLVEEGLTSANAMEARDPTTQQRGRPQSKRKQPVAGPMGPRPKGTRSDN